jgi:hypothetical protein
MKIHSRAGLIAGASVFLINMTENIIHYNIGRTKDNGSAFYIKMPSSKELLLMTGTSLLAGIIVGIVVKKIK